jgi:hypothetical protein
MVHYSIARLLLRRYVAWTFNAVVGSQRFVAFEQLSGEIRKVGRGRNFLLVSIGKDNPNAERYNWDGEVYRNPVYGSYIGEAEV